MRRNHDIPFQTVQLVDPATNKLDEPQSKSSILRNMDFSQEALVVVQADPPIVKIINLEEERHAKREFDARAKLQRKTSMEDKELQVPWNAAPSDMQHKINTARNILEKGDRVHLIFATRSGAGLKNKITEEQRLEIVKNFDVQLGMSAKKWKADDQTRGMWICYWQPLPSIQAEHRTKVVGVESDKKRIRDEKKEARRIKEAERLRKAEERKANGGN
jgi:translation initiation factor IF-3